MVSFRYSASPTTHMTHSPSQGPPSSQAMMPPYSTSSTPDSQPQQPPFSSRFGQSGSRPTTPSESHTSASSSRFFLRPTPPLARPQRSSSSSNHQPRSSNPQPRSSNPHPVRQVGNKQHQHHHRSSRLHPPPHRPRVRRLPSRPHRRGLRYRLLSRKPSRDQPSSSRRHHPRRSLPRLRPSATIQAGCSSRRRDRYVSHRGATFQEISWKSGNVRLNERTFQEK